MVAAVALTIAGTAAGCSSGKPSGSTKSAGSESGSSTTTFGPRPASYRIVYHVTQPGDASSERWEELTVRRPFEARDAVFNSRPAAGAKPISGTLATVDHLYLIREQGQLQELSGRQPSSPTGDQALAVDLEEAQRRKVVGPPGTQRSIAGRECTDHPYLEPPAGVIKPLTGTDRDLICIDHDGLVLREEWTLKGKVALLREAETVTIDVPPAELDAALSTAGAAPTPVPSAVPAVGQPLEAHRVVPDPPVPGGFTATTKVGFAMPGQAQQAGVPPPILYISTVWAFARGGEGITVEAGNSAGGPPPWVDTDPSSDVDLPIGKAKSVLRNDGPELRVDLGDRGWVRIRGTVTPEALEAYARTLPRPT